MEIGRSQAASRSGPALVWDVVVAPAAAFASLRERSQWLWGFAIASVLGMLGAFLQIPAGQHVVTATLARQAATDPQYQGMSPEKQHQILSFALATQHYAWLAIPVIIIIAIAFAALVFTIANAVGKGGSSFGKLFGLAANLAFINFGLAALLIGVLASRVGADAISTQRDILNLMPSLSRLAPEGAPKVAALLAAVNPFSIWSFVLIGLGLRDMTKLSPPLVWTTAIVVGFGSGLLGALFAR